MGERGLVIRDLPVGERPRERLEQYGAEALSTAELLAIVLRVGSRGESAVRLAERLLSQFGGLAGIARARPPQLSALPGIGLAKACQVKAAFELGKRLAASVEGPRPVVSNAQDAARLVMEELRYREQECLVAIFLDTRNQVIRVHTVSMDPGREPGPTSRDLQGGAGPRLRQPHRLPQSPQRRPQPQPR